MNEETKQLLIELFATYSSSFNALEARCTELEQRVTELEDSGPVYFASPGTKVPIAPINELSYP